MKTFISTLLCFFAIILTANGQLLYGTTSAGGRFGGGTISTFNTATQTLNAVKSFYVDGSMPDGDLIRGADGKLYGMTGYGGAYGYGTIFSYDAATGNYTQLLSFDGTDGSYPEGSLLQASDGKLYGMTLRGGSVDYGVIFSFDPVTSTYTKLYEFGYANNGSYPHGNLMQASDGKLYGMTGIGGNYGNGVIFSYNLSSSSFSKLYDFDSTSGGWPEGTLLQASDGKLYGTTIFGGVNNEGVIFSFNLATSTYTKEIDFNGKNGAHPQNNLIEGADGKLYGMTSEGGSKNNDGVIFSFAPSTSTYIKLYNFNDTNGTHPEGSLIQAADGKLYGMTAYGGSNNYGVIFSFDPFSSTYTKLYGFNGTKGAQPWGSLLQASDGKLYGMTSRGGINDYGLSGGVIFSYDVSTATYNKLKSFNTNQDGNTLNGGICKASDGNLYGTTTYGGSNNYGVIFSYNPATNVFSKLKDFSGKDGANPQGNLIQASDGKLYGMTLQGGNDQHYYGTGVIFSFDPATATYTKLYDFNDETNGAYPRGSLLQASDGILYGMASRGGTNDYGVIFSYNPATSTFKKVFDFDGKSGVSPNGSLIQASDGKLYGMTTNGGDAPDFYGNGVIFSFDPSTSTYTKKYNFEGFENDGGWPYGSLIQAPDGKLYGMTEYGGRNQAGIIFSFDPSVSTYINLHNFDGINGAHPVGSLLQASDGKLYGMTYDGGSKDLGVAFSYDPAADTNTFQKLADFTSKNGAHPAYTSFVEVPSCTPRTYYRDMDGDSFGNPDSTIQSCAHHRGYVRDSTDCNDQDSTIHPGAKEICGDGIDNNCNGQVDENCPIPKISIGDAIAFEGNSGYKKMNFYVKLSSAAYDTVKVQYNTERGTATASEDYVPVKGTLTFMPGEKEQAITILIKGDQQAEYPELFKVQLSNPSNATISKDEGTGIIIDDDLKLSSEPFIVEESTSTDHSIIVTPNPASSMVNVELNGFRGNTTLQLVSLTGKLLKEIQLQLKGTTNQQLHVADLASGTYFLTVADEKGNKQTVKLVIAR